MSNGKKLTKRRIKKKNNDCFWMENIFCLESHIHLCSRNTSAIPAYVIKTCVTWHAISGTRYWGFVSPKLHVSTYRNQQHCAILELVWNSPIVLQVQAYPCVCVYAIQSSHSVGNLPGIEAKMLSIMFYWMRHLPSGPRYSSRTIDRTMCPV